MFLKTSIAALTVLAFAGAASAESAGVSAGVKANAEVNASAEGKANLGQVVSGFQNGKEDVAAWTGKITTLADNPQVEIIALSELNGQGAMNAQSFDKVLEENSANVSSARMAIESNEDLVAALEAKSYTAEQVVMVNVESDQNVTLVVDDRG